jgi:hypothetical protein
MSSCLFVRTRRNLRSSWNPKSAIRKTRGEAGAHSLVTLADGSGDIVDHGSCVACIPRLGSPFRVLKGDAGRLDDHAVACEDEDTADGFGRL